MNIFVCRHGEYENKLGLIPHRLPGYRLSTKGLDQARLIAEKLSGESIGKIFSSPVLRCKQTAVIIGKILNLPVLFSRSLTEVYSPFQGTPEQEFVDKGYNVFNHPIYLKQGGEPIDHQCRRMGRLVKKVLNQFPHQNILIASHGDPIMSLIAGLVDNDLTAKHLNAMDYIPKGGLIKMEFISGKLGNFQKLIY